jgi:hypothetical protein
MKLTASFRDQEITYLKPIKLPNKELASNIFSRLTLIPDDQSKRPPFIDIFGLLGFYCTTLAEKKTAIIHFFSAYDLNFNDLKMDLPFFNTTSTGDLQISGEILFDIECALFNTQEDFKIHTNAFGISEINNNVSCVKIKISPELPMQTELAIILNKKSIEGELPLLRFDGNRKFELDQLLDFLNLLNDSVLKRIEYIEEPFINFYDLYSFRMISKIKIAIDESFFYYQNSLQCLPSKSFLILKPALFGISRSYALIKEASLLGHSIIISSTYQPASTFMPLLALATYSDSFKTAPLIHGLDTLSFIPDTYKTSQVLNSLIF